MSQVLWNELAIIHLDQAQPWHLPFFYLLVWLGSKWLGVVAEARWYPSVEWKRELSFEAKFFETRELYRLRHFATPFVDWVFAFPMFFLSQLCWERGALGLGLGLALSWTLGCVARLVSVRRELGAPPQSLKYLIGLEGLAHEGSPWYDGRTLLLLAIFTYPYSPFALLLVFFLSPWLPKHAAIWWPRMMGICSLASSETRQMVEQASMALGVRSPHCVVADVPAMLAFARPLEGLVVMSRQAMDHLDRPELRQAILDHEVAHMVEAKKHWHPRLMSNFFWLGAGLVGLTLLQHVSFVPSWPLARSLELLASGLVLLLGFLGLFRNLLKNQTNLPSFRNSKEFMKRTHLDSEQREAAADAFARSRVGKEVYAEALTRVLGQDGEISADQLSQFGYPALSQRLGREKEEEDQVLQELEDMPEGTVGLGGLFRVTLRVCAALFVVLAFALAPLAPIAGAFVTSLYPGSKSQCLQAAFLHKAGFSDKALEVLSDPALENDVSSWMVKEKFHRIRGDKKNAQRTREHIRRLLEGHWVFNKKGRRYLKRINASETSASSDAGQSKNSPR